MVYEKKTKHNASPSKVPAIEEFSMVGMPGRMSNVKGYMAEWVCAKWKR